MSISNTYNYTFRRNTDLIVPDASKHDYYVFAGKSTPWPNDVAPPGTDNSVNTLERTIFEEILFGVHLNQTDIKLMIPRYDWTSGTVYDMFDDKDIYLFSKQFFVITNEAGSYHVFKCLNNNNDSASTIKPTVSQTSIDLYSDGYQWKYMFSIDTSSYSKFTTSQYIPVIANTDVSDAAVSGSIDAYKIESANVVYDTYTSGYFQGIAVDGDDLVYTIQGPDRTVLTISGNTFSRNEVITQAYDGGSGRGSVYRQIGNILELKNVRGVFVPSVNTIIGAAGNTADVLTETSPSASSNNGFYDGCSVYIKAGTGAGQIATITDYTVLVNTRRITIDQAFPVTPDLTSQYEIAPQINITGDGSGAIALAKIDSDTNILTNIQVVNTGSGYNYANVVVVANGNPSNITANVRAILAPSDGHGFDQAGELNATYVGYTTVFSNGINLPDDGSEYRKIGIIVNPMYANVTMTYSYDTTPSLATGFVVQGTNSTAHGIIQSTDVLSNTIYLSNVTGTFITNEAVVVTDSSNNNSTIIMESTNQTGVFNNRLKLTCPTDSLAGPSTFSINDNIVQATDSGDIGYGVIQDINTDGSNTVIYLTEVKGRFEASNTSVGVYKYIYDVETRQTLIRVDALVDSDMVPYTGKVLYVENIAPITRNVNQSEKIKLILGSI